MPGFFFYRVPLSWHFCERIQFSIVDARHRKSFPASRASGGGSAPVVSQRRAVLSPKESSAHTSFRESSFSGGSIIGAPSAPCAFGFRGAGVRAEGLAPQPNRRPRRPRSLAAPAAVHLLEGLEVSCGVFSRGGSAPCCGWSQGGRKICVSYGENGVKIGEGGRGVVAEPVAQLPDFRASTI